MAAVLKTVDPKGFGGSNPSLSAKRRQLVANATSCFWFRPVAKASFRRGPGPKTVAGGPSGRQLPSALQGPPRRAERECAAKRAQSRGKLQGNAQRSEQKLCQIHLCERPAQDDCAAGFAIYSKTITFVKYGLGQLLSDEQKVFVGEIMPLNIEARYPSYKQIIGDALSENRCKELMQKTKELQQWVKTML